MRSIRPLGRLAPLLGLTILALIVACSDLSNSTEPSEVKAVSSAIGDAAAVNQAPFGLISAPAHRASYAQGVSVSFAGSATDPENGLLTGGSLVWRSHINGVIGTGTSFTKSNLSVGEHTITLTSTDSQGASFSHNIMLTITAAAANQSPVAAISAPASSASFTQGASVSFAGTGSDPENGALSGGSLVWTSSLNGQIGTGASFATTALAAGTHTITLTASDAQSATGVATRNITITAVPNSPPVAAISAPANGSTFPQGDPVWLVGTGTDPESGALSGVSLVWTSNRDGQIATGASPTTTALTVGTHTITLTAKDQLNATGVATRTVTVTAVSNQSPFGLIDTPAHLASFAQGVGVLFSGTASDPETGPLTGAALVWRSDRDGQIGTGTSFTKSNLTLGEHTISLTSTDPQGKTFVHNKRISITAGAANQPPVASMSAPASNASFVQGASVSMAGTGTDPENGALSGSSLVWSSSRDGQIGTGTSYSTTGLSVGTHTITLTARDALNATGVATRSITITTPPAPPPPTGATQLSMYTQPSSSAQSGATFSQQPSVRLRDANNNTYNQSGVVITAVIASGGGTLGGTVTATTNSTGRATFSNLSIGGTTGTRTLRFSAPNVTSVTSTNVAITAGSASQLAMSTQPSGTASSGVSFSTQPVVQLRDAWGNAVSLSGRTVTAAIASGSGSLGGTSTATTNSSGVATFSGLRITGSGAHTLRFTASGVSQATSSTITIGQPAASALSLVTQPLSAITGLIFTTQPSVQLRDASGNAVSQSGVVVTASVASGLGLLLGTNTATTNSSGVAVFSNLAILGIGTSTLRFVASGLSSVTSSAISIGAAVAAATNLGFLTQPSSSATSGVAFGQQPAIQLRNASNGAVSQSGVVVTAVIASGGGTLGGTTTATTNSSGVATFSNLSISGSSGNRTLNFSGNGLTSATSNSINVASAAPPPPPPSGGEPFWATGAGTLVMQDNMERYSSTTSMGAYPYQYSGPMLTPLPSPSQQSQPVNTAQHQVIANGRSGKGLRMIFTGQNQTAAAFATINVGSQPDNQTVYIQYWARIIPSGSWPNSQSLSVKWLEAWHNRASGRLQWNTRWPSTANAGAPAKTVWQVIDQGESPNNGDQPVGPYFHNVADGQWHRFTHAVRAHASTSNKNGFAKMWVDGTLIINVSQATVGVVPPGGTTAWCNQTDVNNMVSNDGTKYLVFGATQTTSTGSWSFDLDDLTWWRQ